MSGRWSEGRVAQDGGERQRPQRCNRRLWLLVTDDIAVELTRNHRGHGVSARGAVRGRGSGQLPRPAASSHPEGDDGGGDNEPHLVDCWRAQRLRSMHRRPAPHRLPPRWAAANDLRLRSMQPRPAPVPHKPSWLCHHAQLILRSPGGWWLDACAVVAAEAHSRGRSDQRRASRPGVADRAHRSLEPSRLACAAVVGWPSCTTSSRLPAWDGR